MPAPAGIAVEVLNKHVIGLLQRDIQGLANDLGRKLRFRGALERMRDEVIRPSIDKNFEVGGRPEKWEPIFMASYISRKSVKGSVSREEFLELAGQKAGAKPLSDTGQLRAAAKAKARFHIASDSMTYGGWPQRRWFGAVHDLGLYDPPIPQRAFVLFQEEDKQHIYDITLEWVEDRVNENIHLVYI